MLIHITIGWDIFGSLEELISGLLQPPFKCITQLLIITIEGGLYPYIGSASSLLKAYQYVPTKEFRFLSSYPVILLLVEESFFSLKPDTSWFKQTAPIWWHSMNSQRFSSQSRTRTIEFQTTSWKHRFHQNSRIYTRCKWRVKSLQIWQYQITLGRRLTVPAILSTWRCRK